jgi:hypothetical protein
MAAGPQAIAGDPHTTRHNRRDPLSPAHCTPPLTI